MTNNRKSSQFNKFEQHRLKTDALLKVAAECFNQKGIVGTSLKDVAKELDITDAALYYYVKNKEELVNLCYIRALDLGENALDRAIAEGSDCLEKIQLYIRYQLEEVCGEDGPVAILSEIPSLKEDHRKLVLSRSRRHSKRLTQILADGAKDGSVAELEDPVMVCDAILGALNWTPKWFKPGSNMTSDHIATAFTQIFTSGLSPR